MTNESNDNPAAQTPRDPALTPGGVGRALNGRLGDFELLREIGRGGMGIVYEAFQHSLQRHVALKVLTSSVSSSPNAVTRFQREAQAAAKLQHPHIIPIYAQGEQDGIYYYAMQLVPGPGLEMVISESQQQDRGTTEIRSDVAETVSLSETLDAAESSVPAVGDTLVIRRSDKLSGVAAGGVDVAVTPCSEAPASGSDASPADVALDDSSVTLSSPAADVLKEIQTKEERFRFIAEQMAAIADALDYAHKQGIVHRDIKPHNLLFAMDGRLRVSDFGLARVAEEPGVTMTGELLGSPLYMSAEQITNGSNSVDHRTDIYSLGATMYEWLTLTPPFPGETREQVISRILHSEAVSPRFYNEAIPLDLETVCLKAIAKDPRQRYQTAGEFRDDLMRFLNHNPVRARRPNPLERTGKYLRRNLVATIGACLALCAIATLVGLVLHLGRKLESQKQQQKIEQVAAENRDRERELYLNLLESLTLPREVLPVEQLENLSPTISGLIERNAASLAASAESKTTASAAMASTPAHLAAELALNFVESELSRADANGGGTQGEQMSVASLPPEGRSIWTRMQESDDPVERCDLVNSLLVLMPDHYGVHRLAAVELLRAGEFEKMRGAADRLVELGEGSVAPYILRGSARLLTGMPDEALADTLYAVELDGRSPWTHTLHGLNLLETGQLDDAIEDFTIAVTLKPELIPAWLGRAAARAQEEQYARAIDDVTEVLKLDASNANALAARGEYNGMDGRYAEAAADFDDAMALAGRSPRLVLLYLLMVSQQQEGARVQSNSPNDEVRPSPPGEAAAPVGKLEPSEGEGNPVKFPGLFEGLLQNYSLQARRRRQREALSMLLAPVPGPADCPADGAMPSPPPTKNSTT